MQKSYQANAPEQPQFTDKTRQKKIKHDRIINRNMSGLQDPAIIQG